MNEFFRIVYETILMCFWTNKIRFFSFFALSVLMFFWFFGRTKFLDRQLGGEGEGGGSPAPSSNTSCSQTNFGVLRSKIMAIMTIKGT